MKFLKRFRSLETDNVVSQNIIFFHDETLHEG